MSDFTDDTDTVNGTIRRETRRHLINLMNRFDHPNHHPTKETSNVVTSLLSWDSCFCLTKVTTSSKDMIPCSILGYLISHIVSNNDLGLSNMQSEQEAITNTLDKIPNHAWTIFAKNMHNLKEAKYLAYNIINSRYCNKSSFFKFVPALAKRLHVDPDAIYADRIYLYDEELKKTSNASWWLPYTAIKTCRSDLSLCNRFTSTFLNTATIKHHMKTYYFEEEEPEILRGWYSALEDRPPVLEMCLCANNNNSTIVMGSEKVCKSCGLVIGGILEFETTYDDGKAIKHLSEAPTLLPHQKRYNKSRTNQKALQNNRAAFIKKLELFYIPLQPRLLMFLSNSYLVSVGFNIFLRCLKKMVNLNLLV